MSWAVKLELRTLQTMLKSRPGGCGYVNRASDMKGWLSGELELPSIKRLGSDAFLE